MAYARVTMSEGTTLEVGIDSLDDAEHLDALVRAVTILWQVATTDDEAP